MAPKKKLKTGVDGTGISEAKGPIARKLPDYNALENLAVARATIAIRRKPNQVLASMEADTKALYSAKLDEAVKQFPELWPSNVPFLGDQTQDPPLEPGEWTPDLSAMLRSTSNLYKRWQDNIRKESVTVLSPMLSKLYNENGELPSGTSTEHLITLMKEAYWLHLKGKGVGKGKKTEPIEIDNDVEKPEAFVGNAEGAENGHADIDAECLPAVSVPPCQGSTFKSMPNGWDGGPLFFQWLKLGPLGLNVKDYKIPAGTSVPIKSEAAGVGESNGTSRQSRLDEARRVTEEKERRAREAGVGGGMNKLHLMAQMYAEEQRKADQSEFFLRQNAWESKRKALRDEWDMADGGDEKATIKANLKDHNEKQPNFDVWMKECIEKREIVNAGIRGKSNVAHKEQSMTTPVSSSSNDASSSREPNST